VAAFGLPEKEHGADIYSTGMVLIPDGTGGFRAKVPTVPSPAFADRNQRSARHDQIQRCPQRRAMSIATGTPRRDEAPNHRIDVPPTAELVPDLQHGVDPVPENHRPALTVALTPIIRAPRGRQQGLGTLALAEM
jgi:hypothetical protein